ncbi:hypothetical protein [Marinobacter sp.]|uniref:hypothetical protein n=1 Tax=Marinobacter sp. TaxID=50741 RepID=UPI003569CEF2
MKLTFVLFLLTTFGFSSAVAFDYHDNFEGYEGHTGFSDGYNKVLTSKNSVNFSPGVETTVLSLSGSIPGIGEIVPSSPKNSKVDSAVPSDLRTGGCIDCVISFEYEGTDDLSEDAWSEQRFALNPEALPSGADGLQNIWIQYDKYIPRNYHYRDADSAGATNWFGGGHKVLALYADTYSGLNPTLIIGRLFKRQDSTGPLPLDGTSFPTMNFSTKDPATGQRRWFKDMGFSMGEKIIIDPEVDKGHWQRRTFHIQMPTSETSNDGVVEFWIQRRAETGSSITEKLIDVKNGNFYGGNQNYINSGYLLGWSNTGYNQDVTYLVDNLIVSDDVDSIDLSAIEVAGDSDFRPNAPTLIIE